MEGSRPAVRLRYIDCARGLAVLLMIEAHTIDAWTRPAARSTIGFRNATILGGFAAPLFLWLAGLGVAVAAARAAERHGRRAAVIAACRRGLEIFVLAFLFRLQALLLTPGGPLITFFRVDILNVMGPAMVAAGLLWATARTTTWRVTAFSAATAIIAMSTPIVRASGVVDRLPVWMQWYVRPAGEMTTFTLAPWAAFVFAGAAVGALTAAFTGTRIERRTHAAVAAAGVALIAAGFWTASQPTIYHASSFWTSSPTWFAIRLGVLIAAFEAFYAIEVVTADGRGRDEDANPPHLVSHVRAFAASWQIALSRMGRASLFIYWIHVELVYGYASWLWRRRLPLWGAAFGFIAFSVLMYAAIVLRDGVASRRRRRPRALTQAATA